jgi:hypothetical protein
MKHETDAARAGVEAAVALRRGGKSRGAYLMWLDIEIRTAKVHGDHNAIEALVKARKAFTDEFYPK